VTVQPFLGAPPAWQTDDGNNSFISSDSSGSSHRHNGVAPVELEYDTLVYACGVQASGFGVKGVQEHCYFLKEVCPRHF
jgi:NADH dehydrogenase FAD-containing subunit